MVIGILAVPAPADERKEHILYEGNRREGEEPQEGWIKYQKCDDAR
jgi:hypothetical protein